MLTATLLFFLPTRAAPACPDPWVPGRQPAHVLERGSRCLFVPPNYSTSLLHCVNVCEEHEGAPACIGSPEENRHVTANERNLTDGADVLWLGLYQNETSLGPAKGWGGCVSGDAPNFTNWYKGQPDDYHGYQQECTLLAVSDHFGPGSGNGSWRDGWCDTGLYRASHRAGARRCLCAHGEDASEKYYEDSKALNKTGDDNMRLLMRRTRNAFSIATVLALLPSLLLIGQEGWRRLHRGAHAEPNASPHDQGTAETSGTTSGAGRRLRARFAIGQAAYGRKLRVSFIMAQAGWAISIICWTPVVMFLLERSIAGATDGLLWWVVPIPLGVCVLLLAPFPTDARTIRLVCAALLVMWALFGTFTAFATLDGHERDRSGGPRAALLFAAAAALAPTLRFRGDRVMPPRTALRWLWTVTRLYYLGEGILFAGLSIANYVEGYIVADNWYYSATNLLIAHLAYSVTALLVAALATPRNRGRIRRLLGRLGGRGTEAEEAAAVAALLGGNAPAAALERAARLLRCLPASRLHAADLADGMTAAPPAAGPTLHARTVPAAMGQVTAFLSHSWSDETEAPGAKHALISRWAKRRQETTGVEPTLWLVAL